MRQLRLFLQSYDTVPLEALRYCTGEANYGGRVTDDKDRRCLNALLRNFYNFDALSPGYQFQKSGVGQDIYLQPQAETWDEYVAALRELPTFASPEVFGLHVNAAITKELKETRELFDAILLTQARVGRRRLSGDDLLARSPTTSAKLPGLRPRGDQGALPGRYLSHEHRAAAGAHRLQPADPIVRSSLVNLKKAIKGLV